MPVTSAIAALVMEMTYGLNITSNEDRFLRTAIEAIEVATRAMVPGKYLVDIIPIRASSKISKIDYSPADDRHQ